MSGKDSCVLFEDGASHGVFACRWERAGREGKMVDVGQGTVFQKRCPWSVSHRWDLPCRGRGWFQPGAKSTKESHRRRKAESVAPGACPMAWTYAIGEAWSSAASEGEGGQPTQFAPTDAVLVQSQANGTLGHPSEDIRAGPASVASEQLSYRPLEPRDGH